MFNGIFQHVENYLELYLLFSAAIVIIVLGFVGFIAFSFITSSSSIEQNNKEISHRRKHKSNRSA